MLRQNLARVVMLVSCLALLAAGAATFSLEAGSDPGAAAARDALEWNDQSPVAIMP